jgi:hypothetical protein
MNKAAGRRNDCQRNGKKRFQDYSPGVFFPCVNGRGPREAHASRARVSLPQTLTRFHGKMSRRDGYETIRERPALRPVPPCRYG